VARAPVAVRDDAALEVEGPRVLAGLVAAARLEPRPDAVPVALDVGVGLRARRPVPRKRPRADRAGDGPDAAPPWGHGRSGQPGEPAAATSALAAVRQAPHPGAASRRFRLAFGGGIAAFTGCIPGPAMLSPS